MKSIKLTNKYRFFSLTIFLLLLLLSAFFYMERSIFQDNAFQTFLMIKDGHIQVMVNRWPAAVIRFLPFLAYKLGASLQTILFLFSISYALFFLIVSYLVTIKLQQKEMGLLLAIIFVIPVTDAFYWTASELQQGLAILVLSYAIFRSDIRHTVKLLSLSFLSICLIFYHPLLIIPFVFLGVYHLDFKRQKHFWIWVLVFTIFWILKAKFITSWYDIAKGKEFASNLLQYKFDPLSIPSHKELLSELISKYHFVLLFLGLNTFFLIKKKQWLKWSLMLAFTLGYILITHLGNATGAHSFYREVNYLPIMIFIGLPFVMEVVDYNNKHWFYLLIVIFLFSFVRISLRSDYYKDRLDYLYSVFDTYEYRKIVVHPDHLDKELTGMHWGIPFETLLYSTVKGKSSTLILSPRPEKYEMFREDEEVFFSPFETIEYGTWNENYFDLPKKPYSIINK